MQEKSMDPQSTFKVDEREIIGNLSVNIHDRRRGEEQLFKNYSYFIADGIRKYSFTPDEAFDAYSDTILIAIDKIGDGSFEGRSSLKTYIFQIFHNKCLDLLRKKKTNKNRVHNTVPIIEMSEHFSDAAKSFIQEMMEKSDWEALKIKLKELGGNCRNLLLLWADGYTDKEIVKSLDYKTADVVKTSRLRCLEKLRQLYKNREY